MRHFASPKFWTAYEALPSQIQKLADANFSLLKRDPRHPSLQFKKVGRFWSVRVGLRYRALAVGVDDISGSGSVRMPTTTGWLVEPASSPDEQVARMSEATSGTIPTTRISLRSSGLRLQINRSPVFIGRIFWLH